MLVAAVLFIDSFLLLFLQVSIFCLHKRFVVSAGYTEAGTLSQAKIYRPEYSAAVAQSKGVIVPFESQYLASHHLYRL